MSSISIFLRRGVMMAGSYFLQIIGKNGHSAHREDVRCSQSVQPQVVPRRVLRSDQVVLNLVP